MNIYITKLNGMFARSTEQYAQQMTADIAHLLGLREMGIYRYPADSESTENRGRRLDGIIAGIHAGDIVVCQFPTWNGLAFEKALVRQIKAYRGRVVIFVHDLEAMMFENRRSVLRETIELYNEAEVLIVPSQRMKLFLLQQGVWDGMKFIVQEIWDYTTQLKSLETGRWNRTLHFAGNPDNVRFPNTWKQETLLKVYSDQKCQGQQVEKMGWMPPERLLLKLSEGGFGLVWYGNEYWHQYLSMNNSLKLSAYLAAGIPVFAPRGISNQYMLEKNHLGILVDTLEEAAEIVQKMTEEEYQGYVAAVAQFAPLLREGFFTKKCLLDAVQMAMREDMYTYAEANETYILKECVFEGVFVQEAYKNNLAVSWIFKGEAEGFQIYDADTGKMVGEVFHGLEHYFLLRDYPKEKRFFVKAYVRTMKGKMIVAQSDTAGLSRQVQRTAKVSLIMPAYNAEKYIARSIDTALAQSFTDLEILIVNDGSTDQTQEVIDWYRERYPQIRCFYQSNAGQAAARNVGIGYAVGEYIGFMDNDDMIRPDMIQSLYHAAVKNQCDISMTSVYQMRKEGL